MIPVAISIILISFFAFMFVVPPINRYLESLAEQARKETTSNDVGKED
jgi:hypothetical protein